MPQLLPALYPCDVALVPVRVSSVTPLCGLSNLLAAITPLTQLPIPPCVSIDVARLSGAAQYDTGNGERETTQEEGPRGSCGKPGVFGGFSKRVLESRSLRSDFKGAVGELWEGASLRVSFPQLFHSCVTRVSFHRTFLEENAEGSGERGCW
jgi:hypothetical protein